MRCPNDDAHRWRVDMNRIYVRHQVDGKRQWLEVGWLCDPDYKADTWGSTAGCGTVVLEPKDRPPRIILPSVGGGRGAGSERDDAVDDRESLT